MTMSSPRQLGLHTQWLSYVILSLSLSPLHFLHFSLLYHHFRLSLSLYYFCISISSSHFNSHLLPFVFSFFSRRKLQNFMYLCVFSIFGDVDIFKFFYYWILNNLSFFFTTLKKFLRAATRYELNG